MIGFTPDQVRAMSLAEVSLIIDGFVEMRQAEAGERVSEYPTREEHDELFRLVG